LNFTKVQTYIQSGNVIFSAKEKSPEKLEEKISWGIKKKFGFDVQVIVINPKEIEDTLKSNPFIKRKKDSDKLYVIFLSAAPLKAVIESLRAINYLPEEYKIKGRYIYLFVPNGYGKAKLNNNFFENKFQMFGTTRNWKTVNKLFELSASK